MDSAEYRYVFTIVSKAAKKNGQANLPARFCGLVIRGQGLG